MNLSIRKFYLIGVYLMFIAVIGSIINLWLQWNILNIGGKISSIFGGVLLQVLFLGLFYFLYKTTPDITPMTTIDSPELDNIIGDIEKKILEKGGES